MGRCRVALAAALAVLVVALAVDYVMKALGVGREAQLQLYEEYIFTFCHRGPDHERYAGFEASKLAWCPAWIRKFDWYLDPSAVASVMDTSNVPLWRRWVSAWMHRPPQHRRGQDPKTVYAGPYSVDELLEIAARDFDGSHSDRTLVLAGVDAPLSATFGQTTEVRAATVGRLQRFFGRIYYTSKDVPQAGVLTAPMGLDDRHFTRPGVSEAALAAIGAASIEEGAKSGGVLVAFRDTMWHCHLHVGVREEWRSACEAAGASRKSALAWANTSAGADAGAFVRTAMESLPQEAFWKEMSRFRFLLSPWGIGLQSPKTIEALLVFTIPIVQRAPAFEDLVSQGFPLVIVDRWEDITAERLQVWWRELSPRLAAFRRNCLTVEGYWRVLTGEVASCAEDAPAQ